MQLATMEVELATWFERKSPSKWMGGVMRAVRRGIDQGWTRHRDKAGISIQALVDTVAESGVWSAANQQLLRTWTAKESHMANPSGRIGLSDLPPAGSDRFPQV